MVKCIIYLNKLAFKSYINMLNIYRMVPLIAPVGGGVKNPPTDPLQEMNLVKTQ